MENKFLESTRRLWETIGNETNRRANTARRVSDAGLALIDVIEDVRSEALLIVDLGVLPNEDIFHTLRERNQYKFTINNENGYLIVTNQEDGSISQFRHIGNGVSIRVGNPHQHAGVIWGAWVNLDGSSVINNDRYGRGIQFQSESASTPMNAVSYVRTGGHLDAGIRDWSEVFTHKITKYQRFQDGGMVTEINIESVSENYGILIAFFRNGVWSKWTKIEDSPIDLGSNPNLNNLEDGKIYRYTQGQGFIVPPQTQLNLVLFTNNTQTQLAQQPIRISNSNSDLAAFLMVTEISGSLGIHPDNLQFTSSDATICEVLPSRGVLGRGNGLALITANVISGHFAGRSGQIIIRVGNASENELETFNLFQNSETKDGVATTTQTRIGVKTESRSRTGNQNWSDWRLVGGNNISLADELLKFKAYPVSSQNKSQLLDSVYIENNSEHITAENGYSLVWQVLNEKKQTHSRNWLQPFVRHWYGTNARNFWCSITGDRANHLEWDEAQVEVVRGQTGTDQYAALLPMKDDISTGLKQNIIRRNGIRLSILPSSYKRNKGVLVLKGLGRKYCVRNRKFDFANWTGVQFSIKIPVRLALVASRKEQGTDGTILRNIRTVKVVWQGVATISRNRGNNERTILRIAPCAEY